MVKRLVLLLVLCVAAASVVMLALTWDWETIGAGMCVALIAVPALAASVAANEFAASRPYRSLVFWVLLLPIPLYFAWVALFPSPGAASDGADHMARLCIAPILAAGIVPYAVDRRIAK